MSFTGKEKTLVSLVVGGIGSAVTAGAAFVAPTSTAGHVVTGALAVIAFVATTLGVNLVPNSKVSEAVTALGHEAQTLGLIPLIPDTSLDVQPGAHAAPDPVPSI